MCELFAVNAGRPVVVNDYLTEFFDHSHIHRDGWGISWRRDDAAAGGDPVFLHREPVPAYESDYIPRMLAHPVAARRLEAHIRFSTAGRLCEENCHPFRGEDISGRDWTLIHNGILFNEELLASYDLKEAGDTDSERAMLFLLDVLDEAALRSFGVLDFSTTFSALSGAIGQISNLNRLNLILDEKPDYVVVFGADNIYRMDIGQMLDSHIDSGLGATVAGILAAAVALVANGWLTALLVVGVVVLVNQLEGNLLQPVVMGRSMKLHAFVVLIALTIGTVLGGILGAILAVPITAVVWGAIQVWDGPNMPARWARRRGSAPA